MFFFKGPFWGEGKLRGSVLFVVIGAIIVMSVIGAALSKLHGSGAHSELQENRSDGAYYAAISGVVYAKQMAELGSGGKLGSTWSMASLDGEYVLESGKKFLLTTKNTSGNVYEVVSQGIYKASSSAESNHRVAKQITFTPYKEEPAPTPNLVSYNFNNPTNRPDYAMYSASLTRDIPSDLDKSDIQTQNLTVGKDYKYGFGNVWYTGTVAGYSKEGVSAFGTGFRLFFTFKFSTNLGDGFVVSVLNSKSNNYLSCGGDSAEGGMLGYAGDSRVYNSYDGTFSEKVLEYVDKSGFTKGLNPPKFGIEIDTYNNSGGTWKPGARSYDCEGDNGFMNDSANNTGDHIGIMYWGNGEAYLRKRCFGPGATFDGNLKRYSDVRHGEGYNAGNSESGELSYMGFVEKKTYFFRMDVVKDGAKIKIKSWVGACKGGSDLNSACTQQVYGTTTSNHTGTLSDTETDFSDTSKLSELNYAYVFDTHTFTTDENTDFSNFIWGFTSGSGTATQQIDFRNISLSLR